jgi:hypothetical protein
VPSASSVNLLVATVDLLEVQSVLNAIHRADAQTAARLPTILDERAVDTFVHETITPEPRYLPREIIHPTPRYLPRPVLHPFPRVEPSAPPPPYPTARTPHIAAGPQPPWKTMPWQEPSKPPSVIKMVVRPPDMLTKGTLIDLFV